MARVTILCFVLLAVSWAVNLAEAVDVDVSVSRTARPPIAASARAISSDELETMPTRMDSADILRTVPGLQIAQHEGGGKANEYMLRGFYADHGTDIAFSADGIPLNLISHAHGQGYTDLHILIPETIEQIDVQKGPYDPQQGDLATAGSIRLKLFELLPENFIETTGGSYATGRVSAGVNLPSLLSRSYLALEGYRTDGYVDNEENYRRLNLLWKGSQDLTPHSKITFLGTGFSSDWHSSGLIPLRAVEEGLVSAFGSIDPTQGGKTERYNASATYENDLDSRQHIETQAYYTRYLLQLFSNFTFLLDDPVHGDAVEQNDNRQMFGGHAEYAYSAPLPIGVSVTTMGIDSRNDSIAANLWHEQNRMRISSVAISDVWVQTVGFYVKEELPVTRRLRFMGGLRYDRGRFSADGATAQDAILSPKASFILAASPSIDFFTNFGRGFHSNDARSVSTDAGSGLIRAEGVEAGVRGRAMDHRLSTDLVFWALDLDSELTLQQDTGGTQPSGPTRRAGIESQWIYEITPWLRSDLDLDFSQAKFRDTGAAVPLAVNQYFTGGLTAQSPKGWLGSLRFRDVGNKWGDEARTIPLESYCVFDALVGYRRGHWGFQLAVANIANTTWRDGQEVITSKLPGETSPVEDVDFTPGNPRTYLASAKYFF